MAEALRAERPALHALAAVGEPFDVLVARRVSRDCLVSFEGRSYSVPRTIVVDNGSEFQSRALDAWANRRGVQLEFIRPAKPVEYAFIESFNGRLREECLNQHWFRSLPDARRTVEAWCIS